MWVAAAIIGGAIIGGVASHMASETAAEGVESGIAAEERLANESLQLQRDLADEQRADFAPWREAGETALGQIEAGVASGAFTMENFDFTADPGYQFRMEEGGKTIERSASARGMVLSGAQQKELERYGQGFGANEYANAYAREEADRLKQYNILSNLSAGGQSSAAGQAQVTGNLASTTANVMQTLGRDQNVAAQNIGQIRAGAYGDTAKTINQAGQNWLTYQALK